MNRAEKIEAIRKVYGEKVVEGCEAWELVPVNAPDKEHFKCKEWWDGSAWTGGWSSSVGRLGRYPRELPKPKCIVEDADVTWDTAGFMIIKGYLNTIHSFVGNRLTYKGTCCQIAGFLFEGHVGVEQVPIVMHNDCFIRANRVRLVRFE